MWSAIPCAADPDGDHISSLQLRPRKSTRVIPCAPWTCCHAWWELAHGHGNVAVIAAGVPSHKHLSTERTQLRRSLAFTFGVAFDSRIAATLVNREGADFAVACIQKLRLPIQPLRDIILSVLLRDLTAGCFSARSSLQA